MISVGTFVRLKQDPQRAGILEEGSKTVAGELMVPIKFNDGKVSWLFYSAIETVPSETETFIDRFSGGKFVEPDWLRRTLTRLRVTGKLSDIVYSMEATKTDFHAYQFKPVIKLMNSPTDSLLIADEVGLGKTIEAGLVWTELRARLEYNKLLVVCPKTLCDKWKDELAERFGVYADIGDAKMLLNALQQARNTRRGYAFVCSMHGLRPPHGWNDDIHESEGKKDSARCDLARFLDDASDEESLIDLLVVDEAHHMRNPETLLYQFGKLANSVASHRLFLSATPIHLRNRDLFSVLAMVDPDTFEFEQTLTDLIETNAPIIAARNLLLKHDSSISEIKNLLGTAQNRSILRDSQALEQIQHELDNVMSLNNAKRSELAARIEGVNQLANYVTRTRKRDIESFRVIREPKTPMLEMSDDERYFYQEISNVVIDYASQLAVNERFLLSSPQRLLTSSFAASSAYWCKYINKVNDEEIEETDKELLEQKIDKHPLLAKIAQRSQTLNLTTKLTKNDTKFNLLIKELRKLWATEHKTKVIVFSSFIPTLYYLESQLRNEGISTEMLHGSVNKPRPKILARFRDNNKIQVLLSSEVGSEGVDLQFSSIIVNYDLPWNPMRLEQRIGRVDRLGQKRDKVSILNLIYEDTIDWQIYNRLYERLQIGRRALGELEAVLGEPMRDITVKLFDPNLSDQQKQEAIEQTAQALETRQQEEKQLESEAGSLVYHGDYILKCIMESRGQHRWIRDDDILIYVRDRILQDFPQTIIEESPPGSNTWRIDLSADATMAFRDFLLKRGLKKCTHLLSGNSGQRYRFTSSVVHKFGQVECISQLHPLVRFAADLDASDDSTRNAQVVAARLSQTVLQKPCVPGLYVLASQQWSSGEKLATTMANVQIGYVGANISTSKLVEPDLAEKMIISAAEHGSPIPNAGRHPDLCDVVKVYREIVQPEFERRFEAYVNRTRAENSDRINIRLRALKQHFDQKIKQLHEQQSDLKNKAEINDILGNTKRARNLRNLVRAREAIIQKLEKTKEIRINEIEEQRNSSPELFDVGCLLLHVEADSNSEGNVNV